MNPAFWRSVELKLPDGRLAVDVEGSGRLAKNHVVHESDGESRALRTIHELAQVLRLSAVDPVQVAASDVVGFAYLLTVLAGRPARILTPESTLWPDLEQHSGLNRFAHEPRIEAGGLRFSACTHYSPELVVHRMVVNFQTWEIDVGTAIRTPWPPVAVAAE